MSSCLILQQNKNIFIASDTAISSTVLGKRIRVSNSGEKVFTKDNNIIFCSGNVKLANKCKTFIMQMGEFDVAKLHSFLLEMNAHHTMFEVFIGMNGDTVKSYQLSSYNSFEPIERVVERNSEIFALGFNTKQMLQSFENNLLKTNVLEAFRKSYAENICNEVGGNVDIYYFYNGELQKVRYDLNDKTECLLDRFNEEYLHYIMAEQLVGKIILGEQLFIGNGDNTFKIMPEGLYIYDNDASHSLRVFLGIDEDNKARLRLYSANGDNSLVLSEEGIYQVTQLSDRDSFDYSKPFESYFFIPKTLQKVYDAKLIVQIQPFRSYSKSSASTKINLTTTQGSGTIPVNISGVSGGASGTTVSGTSTSTAWGHGGRTTGSSLPLSGTDQVSVDKHIHWIELLHDHSVTINAGSHSHSISITGSANANSHTHDIEMPEHTHAHVYGIYETNYYPDTEVYIGNTKVATLNSTTTYKEIDVTDILGLLNSGTHKLRIKTTNPSHIGRASFTLFWGGFYSY